MAENRAALLARQDTESEQYESAVWSYLHRLDDAVRRERQIISYQTTYTWEPQERTPDLEARVQAEEIYWTEILTRLDPEDPDALCRWAGNLPDPAERIELLYERFRDRPAEHRLATCLARSLSDQNRREEALAVLRLAYAENPHDEIRRNFFKLLGEEGTFAYRQAEAARRPDDFDSQLAFLRLLLNHRDSKIRLRGWSFTEELLGGQWSAEQSHELCNTLRIFRQLQERCWRLLYESSFPDEKLEKLATRRQAAVEALAHMAISHSAWDELAPLLAAAVPEVRIELWRTAVDRRAESFCPHLLAAFDGGQLIPPESQTEQLADALEECGRSEQARQLRPSNEDALDDEPHWLTIEHLHALEDYLWRGSLPAHNAVEGYLDQGGLELVSQVERWAREDPAAISPWLHLAFYHEANARSDDALAAWRGLLDAHPDDLDLVVAMGAAALRLDRPDGIRSAGKRLLSARDADANARHRAEADYLLGRLARREGHWEEASERLERYFLRRLQFKGCSTLRYCDQAFILHLIDAGHRERLDAYLAARAEALATYEARFWERPQPHPRRAATEPPSTRLQVDVAALPLDCTSPRLLERLRALEATSPDDPAVAKRRADAVQRRPCTAEELPDPEATFVDDELLGLSWQLREVG